MIISHLKISQEVRIKEFLKFLVHLTKIDRNFIFIISGSNALNILVEIKVNLTNENFENIRIQNTSLVGGNFTKCNLTRSKFDNVNINGINLSGAQLFDRNWKQLQINDLHQLDGHTSTVNLVCFSPDGNTLASGKTGQKNLILGQQIQLNFGKMQDLPFIKQPFYRYPQYQHSLQIPKANLFKLKELLSLRESLLIFKASNQDNYQNQKEFAFQKAQCKNDR